jgi:putative DNA primase/helicase
MNNYIEQFKTAMREHGIEPPVNVIADGVLHRFDAHKKGAGWYTLHSGEYWAGAFGDWSLDIKAKWRQDSPVRTVISAQQRDEWDKKRKQVEKAKLDLAAKAAKRCHYIYNSSEIAKIHPYCQSKGINLGALTHNARISDGVLLIPIINIDNKIVNLQTITSDGTKKFTYGAQITGCFGVVGILDRDIFYIAEGWATAYAVVCYFKKACFVAFSAGNLKPVAINLRSLYPDATIIIAADNDLSGVGENAAIAAASAVGGSYIIPDVVGADFCDLFNG